jgi:ribose 5-phosphate isomerase B
MGARPVPEALALKIVGIWLDADFEGGRHENRVTKIEG